MKIALVAPYDFAHPGGVTNHISALERQYTQMGHDVRVIAPASRPIQEFGDRFIPIGRPWPIPSSESIIRVPISLHLAPAIKEVVAREKFELIHLHEPFMPMLCSAVLRFSDAVNVGTFHAAEGKPGYNWGKPISTWLIRRRLHKLHGKIVVSQAALSYHSRYIPGPFEIIPNGVDTERFTDDVEPLEQYLDSKKNILFVSRLEFRKGLNYLLNAFLLVKREMPDVRLIVVGRGTRLRRRYERWVRKVGLEDVVFVGFASYQDLPRYYKTADIFSVPATGRESQGLILLEAMATGTPVVTTSIPGYAGVVDHGEDGLLVPPRNYQELSQALLTLLNDEKLRQQMGARGKVKSKDYDWKVVSRRLMDFYQRTIDRVRGSSSQ
ncbi:MAG: glycosyltransferase family 4 protein [Dehalococcoidales bacterium]|nr:MAG: glycosyltransferase family 4 protein [Dehalococcoidales bacterium]